MPAYVTFLDNFTINVVAPFSHLDTTIKLDPTHPEYATLTATAAETGATGLARLAALTVTDGADVEVLSLSDYVAGTDRFSVNRTNEIDWRARSNVKAEMRVTRYELENIQDRLAAIETELGLGGGGGA